MLRWFMPGRRWAAVYVCEGECWGPFLSELVRTKDLDGWSSSGMNNYHFTNQSLLPVDNGLGR